MQFNLQIIGPDGTLYKGQDPLPAPSAELDDILFNAAQSFGCDSRRLVLRYQCVEAGIDGTLQTGESLAELNFLALRLSYLTPNMLTIYRSGLASLRERSTENLINLSYSLDQRYLFRANTDSDIGQEVLDRGLVTIPEELLDCIDRSALGQKYRAENGGLLIDGWFATGTGQELKEVYHSANLRQGVKHPFPDVLERIDCAIKVELLPADAPDSFSADGVWLKLPATDAATSFALEQLGVSSLEKCQIYSIDSTVPEIREASAQINELDQLTDLAEKLDGLGERELDLYNAVLEWELEISFPRPADYLNYLHNLDYYELDTRISDEYELGKHLLELDGYRLDNDLYEYFNFEQYVKNAQKNHHGSLVSLGYISRSLEKNQMEFPYQLPEVAALAPGLYQG